MENLKKIRSPLNFVKYPLMFKMASSKYREKVTPEEEVRRAEEILSTLHRPERRPLKKRLPRRISVGPDESPPPKSQRATTVGEVEIIPHSVKMTTASSRPVRAPGRNADRVVTLRSRTGVARLPPAPRLMYEIPNSWYVKLKFSQYSALNERVDSFLLTAKQAHESYVWHLGTVQTALERCPSVWQGTAGKNLVNKGKAQYERRMENFHTSLDQLQTLLGGALKPHEILYLITLMPKRLRDAKELCFPTLTEQSMAQLYKNGKLFLRPVSWLQIPGLDHEITTYAKSTSEGWICMTDNSSARLLTSKGKPALRPITFQEQRAIVAAKVSTRVTLIQKPSSPATTDPETTAQRTWYNKPHHEEKAPLKPTPRSIISPPSPVISVSGEETDEKSESQDQEQELDQEDFPELEVPRPKQVDLTDPPRPGPPEVVATMDKEVQSLPVPNQEDKTTQTEEILIVSQMWTSPPGGKEQTYTLHLRNSSGGYSDPLVVRGLANYAPWENPVNPREFAAAVRPENQPTLNVLPTVNVPAETPVAGTIHTLEQASQDPALQGLVLEPSQGTLGYTGSAPPGNIIQSAAQQAGLVAAVTPSSATPQVESGMVQQEPEATPRPPTASLLQPPVPPLLRNEMVSDGVTSPRREGTNRTNTVPSDSFPQPTRYQLRDTPYPGEPFTYSYGSPATTVPLSFPPGPFVTPSHGHYSPPFLTQREKDHLRTLLYRHGYEEAVRVASDDRDRAGNHSRVADLRRGFGSHTPQRESDGQL